MKIKQPKLDENWEKYRGSIVMTVDDVVYTAKSPKKALITVVPKEDTLILITS